MTQGKLLIEHSFTIRYMETVLHVAVRQKRQNQLFFLVQQPPSGPGPPHSRGFLDHTQRRTTVDKTPLDE